MKKTFLLLLISILLVTSMNAIVKKTPAKTKQKTRKIGLDVRYYITDMNHNPTVNFTTGESYYVYFSVKNVTQDTIHYKKPGDSDHLFHFMALKSNPDDMNPRFNNQNESLKIPIYSEQDTVLVSQGIVDDYQQITFYNSGFYTIQIMPKLIFPDKYKKDWGDLQFEIECHANPDKPETDPFEDILKSDDLAPILKELEKLPELLKEGNQ